MKRKAEIRELREEHAEEEAEQRLLDERRCMTNEDYAAAFQEKKYLTLAISTSYECLVCNFTLFFCNTSTTNAGQICLIL